jgi:HEAT repeat protein
MGPKAEEAVPSLVAALRDDDEDVRVMVAAALGQIGNKAAVAMPALLVAVKGDSDKVRQRAASAMLAVPEKFYVAIPPLVRAMEDEGPTVRRAVAEALVGKPDGDEKPVPVDRLTRTLRNDRRVETRCSAALLLAVRQQEADQVVGDLQYALDNDQDNYVRWCAKWALSVLRPGSVDN